MIFFNATEYAIRGLSEVAARGSNGRLLLDDVVAGSGLPRDFMAKVFQKLVHAGVLRSAKGRGGGFALARPAHEISLMQVVEAIDGPQTHDRCVIGFATGEAGMAAREGLSPRCVNVQGSRQRRHVG